jgi:hypothetical protein
MTRGVTFNFFVRHRTDDKYFGETSAMDAIPAFLKNYLYWLGAAGIILFFSFLQRRGDAARTIAGLCAAVGVLIFCFTKL